MLWGDTAVEEDSDSKIILIMNDDGNLAISIMGLNGGSFGLRNELVGGWQNTYKVLRLEN